VNRLRRVTDRSRKSGHIRQITGIAAAAQQQMEMHGHSAMRSPCRWKKIQNRRSGGLSELRVHEKKPKVCLAVKYLSASDWGVLAKHTWASVGSLCLRVGNCLELCFGFAPPHTEVMLRGIASGSASRLAHPQTLKVIQPFIKRTSC